MAKEKRSRRDFLAITGLAAAGMALPKNVTGAERQLTLYIGTYTSGKSEGVYIYRMNQTTGQLTHFNTVKGVADPSFLAIDPRRRWLYAVNEVEQFAGKRTGALSAFAIDQRSGDLTFRNQQPTSGAAPCHLFVDKNSRFVLVANYYGGNIAVLPINSDGSLLAVSDLKQHQGSSVNKERQEAPHAHYIQLDSQNSHAFAVDLGLDRVMVYEFDSKSGKLSPNKVAWLQLKPGDGPRHLAFHPTEKFAYVINELSNTIAALTYDKATGAFAGLPTVPTLPKDFSGANTTAEVLVSPSGKFLYGSNRGHDSIVSFEIDQNTGKLTFIEHVPTQGKTPRNFAIDPSARFLLVANQESDTIVSFRINPVTGKLEATGHVAHVPTPVCILAGGLV
jgi:6-phosphogluconolactonase